MSATAGCAIPHAIPTTQNVSHDKHVFEDIDYHAHYNDVKEPDVMHKCHTKSMTGKEGMGIAAVHFIIAAVHLQATADEMAQQLCNQIEITCQAWSAWGVALRWINYTAHICVDGKPSRRLTILMPLLLLLQLLPPLLPLLFSVVDASAAADAADKAAKSLLCSSSAFHGGLLCC